MYRISSVRKIFKSGPIVRLNMCAKFSSYGKFYLELLVKQVFWFFKREMNGKVNKILNGNHILTGKKC